MIRPGKIIKASSIEDLPVLLLTTKEKTLNMLREKDYTVSELSTELNKSDRMIREIVMQLKRIHNITETKCRCGHTPIYRVKK